MTNPTPEPHLSFFARIEVDVDTPLDLGRVAGHHRRIVSILGGTVRGPEVDGRVLNGGADFQVLNDDGSQDLDARYGIELSDGTRLYVENHAIRSGSPDVMARLSRGELVDPSEVYFRSSPRIYAPKGRWAWLNTRAFVASGERAPAQVRLDLFTLD